MTGREIRSSGKTLELVNICSGTQYSFTVGDAADRQIYLPDLEEGTYEIYHHGQLYAETRRVRFIGAKRGRSIRCAAAERSSGCS
ncbi:MAG: hypothetical protein V8Q79_07135 [Christensenellales bacterium]